jgi:hypothetical protein
MSHGYATFRYRVRSSLNIVTVVAGAGDERAALLSTAVQTQSASRLTVLCISRPPSVVWYASLTDEDPVALWRGQEEKAAARIREYVSGLPGRLSITTICSGDPPRLALAKLLGGEHFDQVIYGKALTRRDVRWLRRAHPGIEVVQIVSPDSRQAEARDASAGV